MKKILIMGIVVILFFSTSNTLVAYTNTEENQDSNTKENQKR